VEYGAEPVADDVSMVPGGDDAGYDAVDAGADSVDPGADAVDPGAEVVDPGADDVDAGADEVDAGVDEVDAGADEVDAGADEELDVEPPVPAKASMPLCRASVMPAESSAATV